MKQLIILCLLSFSSLTFAQDIAVHNTIGKKQADVIKLYGNPVHKDNSNPSMMCMFYKGASGSYIFVADEKGVYQAEANAAYDSEKKARGEIDKFIAGSTSNEFVVDTVSISDFNLHKPGVKVTLQVSENKISKKFDIKVKANKTEN